MSDAGLVVTRALAVVDGLGAAGVTCALGGALALGYHVDDPRGTRDIDVNVTLPKEEADRVLRALPTDVPWDDAHRTAILRDGQVRIMWPVEGAAALPVDLFFAESDYHALVATRTIDVPLRDQTVSVLSATDLTVFKTLFDRPKDWIDIQAMLDAHDSSVDLDEAVRWVADIVGEADRRTQHLRSLKSS